MSATSYRITSAVRGIRPKIIWTMETFGEHFKCLQKHTDDLAWAQCTVKRFAFLRTCFWAGDKTEVTFTEQGEHPSFVSERSFTDLWHAASSCVTFNNFGFRSSTSARRRGA